MGNPFSGPAFSDRTLLIGKFGLLERQIRCHRNKCVERCLVRLDPVQQGLGQLT